MSIERESPPRSPYSRPLMRSLHQYWGWAAVAVNFLVGMWGVVLAWRRKSPGRIFWSGVAAASATMVIQVGLGVALISSGTAQPGDQHVFYGIVIAFVLAFAYIYRAQLGRRPALYYGLTFLFVMGLGLRTISTFGADF